MERRKSYLLHMAEKLSEFIQSNGMNASKAMDILQSRGIVSDLCVKPEDVARADEAGAIKFLSRYVSTNVKA